MKINKRIAVCLCLLMLLSSFNVTSMAAVYNGGVSTNALAYGPITQYPSAGGTWQYGFWDVKVRSYYTVNRIHGSSVELNGKIQKSVETASGMKSIAEKWAIQTPNADDHYYYHVSD